MTKKFFWIFYVTLLICSLWLKAHEFNDFNTQIFVFNLFLISVSLPFLYFSFKNVFSKNTAYFVFIFSGFLFSFPHSLFLSNYSHSFFVQKNFILGLDYKFVFYIFVLISILFYQLTVSGKIAVFGLSAFAISSRFLKNNKYIFIIFLLSLIQMFIRFGNYNPYGEVHIPINHLFVSDEFQGFFGVKYASCDANHHFLPASIFVTSTLNSNLEPLVVNDRPIIAFFFHAISPFFHPYIAARIVLYFFYILIVFSFFAMMRKLKFKKVHSFAATVIFMSSYYLVKNATVLDAYIHAYNYAPILILSFLTYLDKDTSFNIRRLFNVLFVSSFFGLGYFPYSVIFNIMFLILFLFFAKSLTKWKLTELIFVFITVLIVKKVFVSLLFYFGLEGNPDNRNVGTHYLSSFRNFRYNYIGEYFNIIKIIIVNFKIILSNYINGEYFLPYGIIGFFGVIICSIFSKSKIWMLNFAVFLSFVTFNLITSIPASLWPHPVWSKNLPLTMHRSIGAQYIISFGMFYVFYFVLQKFKINDKYLIVISFLVYLFSFFKIGLVWLEYHDHYPVFQNFFS